LQFLEVARPKNISMDEMCFKFPNEKNMKVRGRNSKRSVEGLGSREMEHNLYFDLEKKQMRVRL